MSRDVQLLLPLVAGLSLSACAEASLVQKTTPLAPTAAGPPRRLHEGHCVFVGIANALVLEAVAVLAILAICYGASASREMTAGPPASLVAAAFSPG
jgi:hypothetical protein